MQTRKYPRTMQEAFGPYCSRDLLEPEERMPLHNKVLCAVYAVALVVLFFVVVL